MKKQSKIKNILSLKSQDTLFSNIKSAQTPFKFNAKVANTFDDMITRSIPLYDEIQMMIVSLCNHFAIENTSIVDCGCSTGTTLTLLTNNITTPNLTYMGIDNSHYMLDKTMEKIKLFSKKPTSVTLLNKDLNNGLKQSNCSAIILNLMLQFIKPKNRGVLLKDCYKNLRNNTCLILIEKIYPENSQLNDLTTKLYHHYKQEQNYSKSEILNKQAALKKTLIPMKESENIDLLKKSGFHIVETFFKWYNFCGILGIKKETSLIIKTKKIKPQK